MFLRRVDLFDKYPAILEESADFKRFNQELRERTKIIMDLLSERQRDTLLEQHRIKSLAKAKKKIQLA
jgi:acyl-ACP thioesterase